MLPRVPSCDLPAVVAAAASGAAVECRLPLYSAEACCGSRTYGSRVPGRLNREQDAK